MKKAFYARLYDIFIEIKNKIRRKKFHKIKAPIFLEAVLPIKII